MSIQGKYIPPAFNNAGFNCPICGVYADQRWEKYYYNYGGKYEDTRVSAARCNHCKKFSIWLGEFLLYPAISSIEPPHPAMPPDCLVDYEEAQAIFERSPRGAAALLRLVVQKLMVHLDQPGKNIDADIKQLVSQGLPPRVQQALDVCRVVGNHAVHPGSMDLQANSEHARALFGLVNFIVQDRIAHPAEVEKLFGTLPQGAREAISKRDEPKF